MARAFHSATVLDAAECQGSRPPEWCGTVLVTGGLLYGIIADAYQEGLSTAATEIFDPKAGVDGAGAWRPVPSTRSARQGHVAELLFDGQVYVAGGDEEGTAEVYDPTESRWTPTRPLTGNRVNATATRLVGPRCRASTPPAWCGQALIVGGAHSAEGDSLARTGGASPPSSCPRRREDHRPDDDDGCLTLGCALVGAGLVDPASAPIVLSPAASAVLAAPEAGTGGSGGDVSFASMAAAVGLVAIGLTSGVLLIMGRRAARRSSSKASPTSG